MIIANDCTRCRARNDGAFATYCYHEAFSESHAGEGRRIASYPKTPRWCPKMVRELARERPLRREVRQREAR